jgi:hypothetical protein
VRNSKTWTSLFEASNTDENNSNDAECSQLVSTSAGSAKFLNIAGDLEVIRAFADLMCNV